MTMKRLRFDKIVELLHLDMVAQSFKMARKAIFSNKMRSFLTMLGIIIGVIALVVLVSLVSSASTSITDQVSSLGSNLLSVSITDDKSNPLRLDELEEFANNPDIAAVAPSMQFSATSKYQQTEESAIVYSTTAAYMDIQNITLQYGRFIKTTDVNNGSYVAIISYEGADALFGRTSVVGESIALDGRSFEIVGVLAEDSSAMSSMMDSNVIVYIPFTTGARMSTSGSHVTSFYASSTSSESMEGVENALTELLMNRFKQDENAFRIMNQSAMMEAQSSIMDTLSLLLGGIAAISLIVGGIGIMNIMLVSVTERTKEIGIRKAIGATRRSIMIQFLIEALALSLMGCVVGVLISWGIIGIVSLFAGDTLSFHLSAGVVAVAVLFSVGIGVLFGLYPANKAAKKNPIEALRYAG